MEDYARKWTKGEKRGWHILRISELVKAVRSLFQIRIRKLKRSMSTKAACVFKTLHRKLNVVVPADEAPNNIVFICINHYVDCLHLGLNNWQGGNHTYTATTLSTEETIDMSVLSSFGGFPWKIKIIVFRYCSVN